MHILFIIRMFGPHCLALALGFGERIGLLLTAQLYTQPLRARMLPSHAIYVRRDRTPRRNVLSQSGTSSRLPPERQHGWTLCSYPARGKVKCVNSSIPNRGAEWRIGATSLTSAAFASRSYTR